MKKIEQNFEFIYILKNKTVRDLRLVTEIVGSLKVSGKGYFAPDVNPIDIDERYAVDIDYVRWNGNDILPVLECMGQMDEIREAAIIYFARIIDNQIVKFS